MPAAVGGGGGGGGGAAMTAVWVSATQRIALTASAAVPSAMPRAWSWIASIRWTLLVSPAGGANAQIARVASLAFTSAASISLSRALIRAPSGVAQSGSSLAFRSTRALISGAW